MNTQQAYEQMRVYLTRPGAMRAAEETSGCFYEGQIAGETHRCAVGCLLSPAAISELDECGLLSAAVSHLTEAKYDYIAGVELSGVDEMFLISAQMVHDDLPSWDTGIFDVSKLDALAEEHGLTVVADTPTLTAPLVTA